MEKEDLEEYEGKKVKIKTISDWFYTIDIKHIGENHLRGIDKFDKVILLSYEDIKSVFPISGNSWTDGKERR